MRYLKKFNESNGGFSTDEMSIRDFLDHKLNLIDNYKINPDGTVDVDGNVTYFVFSLDLDYIPIQFGYVRGSFQMSDHRIRSLVGCPRFVGGDFNVMLMSKITSLEGSPEEVGGGFYCSNTGITDLKGGPKRVDKFFASECENLTSLEGIPKFIQRNMSFKNCHNLWYPGDLRDSQIGEFSDRGLEFGFTPLGMLLTAFSIDKDGPKDLKNFQNSLDYNYLKPPMTWYGKEFPTIDLFKFREALDELEIEIDFQEFAGVRRLVQKSGNQDFWAFPENIGRYIFVNQRGERVDIEGNVVDESEASELNERPDWGF